MADQRRRGRGRSGRGGRIPRKGEAPTIASPSGEVFVSFPLDVAGPIAVTPALDEAAVAAALLDTLSRERRQAEALRALAERSADAMLAELAQISERHRDAAEQLARDLGADVSGADGRGGGAAAEARLRDLVAEGELCRLGWMVLQRAAYASGDRRIDRVVKPIAREKERQAGVLKAYAARQLSGALFREPED